MKTRELAKAIAEYIIKQGTTYTDNGSWCVFFEEIDEHFDTDIANDKELISMVEEYLDPDIVAEYEIDEDGFDMMFYLAYCGIEEED